MNMRGLLVLPVVYAAASLMFSSCDRTPDYVIKPDDMASLLVDIHKGEGVVDLNSSAYRNDSARKVLKQSIYMRHGVTAEQVDTSLEWYGPVSYTHLDVYKRQAQNHEKKQ